MLRVTSVVVSLAQCLLMDDPGMSCATATNLLNPDFQVGRITCTTVPVPSHLDNATRLCCIDLGFLEGSMPAYLQWRGCRWMSNQDQACVCSPCKVA